MDNEKASALKEHEKFWAFIFLVIIIVALVTVGVFFLNSDSDSPATDVVFNSKLRIIDASVGGLLTIAGMAAQALFRVSSVDRLSAETALEAARKLPDPPKPEPQEVKVVNPPSDPANVQETPAEPAADDSELPEYAR